MHLDGGRARALGTWMALTLAVGVAAAAVESTSADEAVAAVGADESPAQPPTPPTSAVVITTTTTAIPSTTVVETTTTTPAPAASNPAAHAPTTTEPPVADELPPAEPPTTVPPARTYSQTPESLSASTHTDVFHTRGEGCTGPGHVSDEYGILGITELADGSTFTGDRVPVAPGGRWESTFFVGTVGTHLHRMQCTLLDGTVVFEYEPQPFTITP